MAADLKSWTGWTDWKDETERRLLQDAMMQTVEWRSSRHGDRVRIEGKTAYRETQARDGRGDRDGMLARCVRWWVLLLEFHSLLSRPSVARVPRSQNLRGSGPGVVISIH